MANQPRSGSREEDDMPMPKLAQSPTSLEEEKVRLLPGVKDINQPFTSRQ